MSNYRLLGDRSEDVKRYHPAPACKWVSIFSPAYYEFVMGGQNDDIPYGHWDGRILKGDSANFDGEYEIWVKTIGDIWNNINPSKMRITFKGTPANPDDWSQYISDNGDSNTYYDGSTLVSKEVFDVGGNVNSVFEVDFWHNRPLVVNRLPANFYDTSGDSLVSGYLELGSGTQYIEPIAEAWLPAPYTSLKMGWTGTVGNIEVTYREANNNVTSTIYNVDTPDSSDYWFQGIQGTIVNIEFTNSVNLIITQLEATIVGQEHPPIVITDIEFYICPDVVIPAP